MPGELVQSLSFTGFLCETSGCSAVPLFVSSIVRLPVPFESWISAYNHPHDYNFITANGYKAKLAERKSAWSEVQKTPSASFQESSLSRFTQTCFIHLTMSCYNTCEFFSTRKVCLNLGFSPGILLKAGHVSTLGLLYAIILYAGVQHNSYCFCKEFSDTEPCLSENGGEPHKIQGPRCKLKANLVSKSF